MLFRMFVESYLLCQGLQARGGRKLDLVSMQRNTRKENKAIKAGSLPEGLEESPDPLWKNELDARWVNKNMINYYCYMNSICIDIDH